MTEPLTDQQLAVWAADLTWLTKGPWLVAGTEYDQPMIYVECEGSDGGTAVRVLLSGASATETDVQFMTRSPERIAALLAEVTRLRTELDQAQRAYIFDTAELKRDNDRLRADLACMTKHRDQLVTRLETVESDRTRYYNDAAKLHAELEQTRTALAEASCPLTCPCRSTPPPARWDKTVVPPNPADTEDTDTLVCCIAGTGQPIALWLDDGQRETLGLMLIDPGEMDLTPACSCHAERVHQAGCDTAAGEPR